MYKYISMYVCKYRDRRYSTTTVIALRMGSITGMIPPHDDDRVDSPATGSYYRCYGRGVRSAGGRATKSSITVIRGDSTLATRRGCVCVCVCSRRRLGCGRN